MLSCITLILETKSVSFLAIVCVCSHLITDGFVEGFINVP